MAVYAPFVTSYTGEPSRPSGGPQPGAIALDAWVNGESPWASSFTSLGIYVPRDICGNFWPRWRCVGSQHARGAALDAGCRVITGGNPAGTALAAWLVKHHAVLGVQEVIWNRRRWTNQTRSWAYYSRSPHTDHVHIALNTSGARYLTRARILSVAPDGTAPTPPPKPKVYDMAGIIMTSSGLPTRYLDGPLCFIVGSTAVTKLVAKGIVAETFTAREYNYAVAHALYAQGRADEAKVYNDRASAG